MSSLHCSDFVPGKEVVRHLSFTGNYIERASEGELLSWFTIFSVLDAEKVAVGRVCENWFMCFVIDVFCYFFVVIVIILLILLLMLFLWCSIVVHA